MGRRAASLTEVMSQSSGGTATNLLRTAWDLCAADVAFLALRHADGALRLTSTFPEHASWTPEVLCKMAYGVWEDPGLEGGKVLVAPALIDDDADDGTGRGEVEPSGGAQMDERDATSAFNGGHRVTIAAAAVIDRGISDEVRGLLCVVNPATGYFDEDQLDALNGLAMRLSAHMKAREEVFGSAPALWLRDHRQPGRPLVDRRHPAAEEAARQILASQGAPPDAAAAGIRTSNDPVARTHDALAAMLDPDPVTGLPGAAVFLAKLGHALGTIEKGENELAILLLEIVDTPDCEHGAASADELVRAAAAQLEGCVRHDDDIARVAPGAFAVLCRFRTGVDRASVLQGRLVATLKEVLAETEPHATVRSSLARATPQALRSPEGLFLEAVENLDGP